MIPIFFSLLRVMAASTSGMALRIGKGEMATSSLTQKWPPMEVIAAAAAPAAFIRWTNRAKISACLPGSRLVRLRLISRTSAWAIVSSSGMPEAACRSIRPR